MNRVTPRRGLRGILATGALAALCMAVTSAAVAAEPGDLDPKFGKNGKLRLDFSRSDQAQAVAIDSQRRVVIVGSTVVRDQTRFMVVRLRPNGALDPDFSSDGLMSIRFGEGAAVAQGVAIQPNDGIVVVGGSFQAGSSPAIAQVTEGGRLDRSFSDDGRRLLNLDDAFLDDRFNDVAIHEGGVVAVGHDDQDALGGRDYDMVAARFLADGQLDQNFAGDGIAEVGFSDATYSDDAAYGVGVSGTDVVLGGYAQVGTENDSGGYDFGAVRLTSAGALDDTTTPFGGDGLVMVDFGTTEDYGDDLVVRSDGKVVIGGWAELAGQPSEAAAGLARLETDGDLDPTFDGDGDPDGMVQEDFGDDQFAIDQLALDAHQRIFGIGRIGDLPSDLATASFLEDGAVADGWDGIPLPEGLARTDFAGRNDRGSGIAIQGPAKPVVVGLSQADRSDCCDVAVARYKGLPTP